MPHNAVIIDEQTGEQLLLWASLKERVRFQNKITSEPIDVKRETTEGKLDSIILAEKIDHLPVTFQMTVDLIGDPSRPSGSIGGEGYEVEQYAKLAAFSNRDTTFTVISYAFVNTSAISDTIVPGLVFQFMGIEDSDAVKSGKKQNIIGAKINFKSIVITYGGIVIEDPDVGYGIGSTELEDAHSLEGAGIFAGTAIGASVGGWTAAAVFGTAATVIIGTAAAAVTAPVWAVGIAIGAVVGAVLGSLVFGRGSVPHQRFRTEIEGIPFDFAVRTNYEEGFCTFSVSYDGEALIQERKIVYGFDLFDGIVHPIVSGLHIVPIDSSGNADTVTPDNLGLTVKLYVISENGVDVAKKTIQQFQEEGGGGWRILVTTAEGVEYFSRGMQQPERGTGEPVGRYVIRFNVEFDTSSDHNSGVVQIFNVAPESISNFQRGELLLLEAGYQPWPKFKQTVFTGTIGDVIVTKLSTVTNLLTIHLGDSTDIWATAVTSKSFRPGICAKTVARSLIREMGLGIGRIRPKVNPIYLKGLSFVGAIRPELEMLARDMQSRLHVSRRKVYILGPGEGIKTDLVLSGENGLLRSKPAINLPSDFQYVLKLFPGEENQVFEIEALLTTEIWADSIFTVEDDTIDGEVRAVAGSHSCDGTRLITTVRIARTLRGVAQATLDNFVETWYGRDDE